MNKGTFNGVFWAIFMFSLIFGNLMGAFVLGNLNKFIFYCIMTGLCIGSAFFFLLLSEPEQHQTPEPDTEKTEAVSVV